MYAKLGYRVFPCRPGKKSPATEHGFHDAVRDPHQLSLWWAEDPCRNIGLSAAGLLIVDLDTPDHPWVEGPWPEGTPISLTPRGGRHLYFRRPAGKNWACSEGKLEHAVDIRTDGGYVLEAPSLIHDPEKGVRNGRYRWTVPLRRPEELPEPPSWLVAALDVYHEPTPQQNTTPPPTGKAPTEEDLKAGDDFNSRGTWEETGLFAAGWTWERQTGADTGHLTRPGKNGGTSATGGICKSKATGAPLFYGFSGNAELLPAREPLSKFAVCTFLQHGGDFRASARRLAALGYGSGKKGASGPTSGDRGSEESDSRTAGKGAAPRKCREIPPWAPFPTHVLPPIISAYVTETASAMNTDEAYVALPALTAIGSAIGNTHTVSPKKGWKEPPTLWTVSIGLSGTTKSPPYRDVEDMAQDINDRLEREYENECAEYDNRVAHWEELNDGGVDAGARPRPPVLRAFIKSDATIEAMIGVLQDNPRGNLIGRDELAGWVGGWNKYGGKTVSSELQHWLQLSNAGTIDYIRKTGDRKRIRVRGVSVGVCGTIQPGIIASLLTPELKAAGLFARLLGAYPPVRLRTWTEAEVSESTRDDFFKLMDGLQTLPFGTWEGGGNRPHLVRLTDPAKAVFVEFYNTNGEEMYEAEEDQRSSMSKLEGYALRFALIFHCCRYPDCPREHCIGLEDMSAAVELTRWFVGESNRISLLLGEQAEDRDLRTLADRVERKAMSHGGRITVQQLQNSNSKKYKRSEQAESDLEALAGGGFGAWELGDRPGQGGHRPRYYRPTAESDRSEN